jgi:hypothetical protein
MTSAQAIDIFNLLLDKTGSPYLTDEEILKLLNSSQLEILNRMVPDSLGGVTNFEFDSNTAANIQPLVCTIAIPSTEQSGVITFEEINDEIQSVFEDETAILFRIQNICISATQVPVRFIKANNRYSFEQNTFKKPTATNSYYTLTFKGIQLSNIPIGTLYELSCIKYPKVMTADNSPDWGDYVMNQVIFKALELAGVSVRDSELTQGLQQSGIQSAQ